jgi:cysteine-rich repeat protein
MGPTSPHRDDPKQSVDARPASGARARSASIVFRVLAIGFFALLPLGTPLTASVPESIAPTLVTLIDTARLWPPSPDPAGLAYRADPEALLISDPGVDDSAVFQDVNLWETMLSGTVVDAGSTGSFDAPGQLAPSGLAYDPVQGRYFVTNRDAALIFELDPGPDGRLGSSDDLASSFPTDAFGSHDPQGIGYDTLRGHLFLADASNSTIYEIAPGANQIFDGVAPGGDDEVSGFDTAALGIASPTGVDHNPDADTLFIVGDEDVVLEATTSGSLVRQIDLAELQALSLAGVLYAPASDDPDIRHLYLADQGLPQESDGRLYEVTLGDEPGRVSVRIETDLDDASESPLGTVSLSDALLELARDPDPDIVGLRFTGVTIPAGARITEAYVQFTAGAATSFTSQILIQAEAADAAAPFGASPEDLSTRSRTSVHAFWSPPAWTAPGAVGPAERSPDLSLLLQEIVDRPGWTPGNAIAVFLEGTGNRLARAHDADPAGAARLQVRFAPSGCGNGVKEPGERCDAGDLGSLTCQTLGCTGGALACTSTCVPDTSACTGCPSCGDGVLEFEEECDDANTLTEPCGYGEPACLTCSAGCGILPGATSFCGDGFVDVSAGEQCDDANPDDADGCPTTCSLGSGSLAASPTCGNGTVETENGEECDDANADNTDACLDTCLAASCGDGFTQTGVEQCDDGTGCWTPAMARPVTMPTRTTRTAVWTPARWPAVGTASSGPAWSSATTRTRATEMRA